MPEDNLPARQLRASDADRDRIAEVLRQALAEGRVSAQEHSERIDRVYAARTYGELEPLVADLPRQVGEVGARRRTGDVVQARRIPPQIGAFSHATVRPAGPVAGRVVGTALCGGVTIDLRRAEIADAGLEVNAQAICGGVDILVGDDVRVALTGVPLFGGLRGPRDPGPADGPVLTVRGVAICGGISVRRRSRPDDPDDSR